jgi:hypothetical protein
MKRLLLVALLAIACTKNVPVVQWNDYEPSLQFRIDTLAAQAKCQELQDEFDTAEAGSAAMQEGTGHGNSELMAYIDAKMRAADCYE